MFHKQTLLIPEPSPRPSALLLTLTIVAPLTTLGPPQNLSLVSFWPCSEWHSPVFKAGVSVRWRMVGAGLCCLVPVLWSWLRAPSLGSSLPAFSSSSFHCPAVWDSSHTGNLPALCLLCADDSGSRGSCCLVNGVPRNSAASGVCCRASLWQPYRLQDRCLSPLFNSDS